VTLAKRDDAASGVRVLGADGAGPASHQANGFVRPFPWLAPFSDADLSTTRGFIFQYPPFPVAATLTPTIGYKRDIAGLYIHLPFCPYHCAYCYYSVSLDHRRESMERYLRALGREIESVADRFAHLYRVATVFFGGGTPTYLDSSSLLELIGKLRSAFGLSDIEEFTVESDPTTLSLEKLQALRYGGVDRLSIGVQSFSTAVNFFNERKHTFEESLSAVALARMAGFSNINLDLICGLMGETESSWNATLATLLSLAPEHVTVYLFSLRPQTSASLKLSRSGAAPPCEALRVEWMTEATRKLLAAGYTQTTANCFVRSPEFEQIHQRNAWSSLPLIGIGNSAYSFVNNSLIQNVRPMEKYVARVLSGGNPGEIDLALNARDLMTRYCILRLKQLRIPRAEFRQRFGFDLLQVFGAQIETLVDLGLVVVNEGAVTATPKGTIYVDDACRLLYAEDVRDCMSRVEETDLRPLIRSLA
jgi:oxygen-independent coproporphyrinogen III oxidase